MPCIFESSTTQFVGQRRFEEPFPIANVVLTGPPQYRFLCYGKLRAAGHPYHRGHIHVRKELLECLFVDMLSVYSSQIVSWGHFILDGLDLVRAAQYPDTAQVDIA